MARIIKIDRKRFSQQVTIYLPDGSSEQVAHQKAVEILKREGVKDPTKVLDHVWNFHTATVHLTEPPPSLPDA